MLAARVRSLSWVQRSLLLGAALTVVWTTLVPAGDLTARAAFDAVVFIVVPGAMALAHGRHLGWRVNRRAVVHTALLALFVLPFYLVGSSLPTVRAYYPMWQTTVTPLEFLPHATQQLVVVVAAETYYRGLLCVGVREIGFKSVFISPVVYAFHHVGKPPVELLLSAPADVLFGAVDYRSESILPSIVAHGLGLALLDWLVLHPPLFSIDQIHRWLSWLPVPL
jgi:hypothetical protein